MGIAAGKAVLPPNLDSSAAEALLELIAEKRGTGLTLDGSTVERAGGLCLQVLAAAKSTWAKDGSDLVIDTPSEALTEATRIAGLSEQLFDTRETESWTQF